MPKKYRGGKGREEPPLSEEEKDFNEVDRTPDGIAVIHIKEGHGSTDLPLYSNSPNTVYFALGKSGSDEPHKIGIYSDYQLIRSIDFDKVRGEHYHLWGNPKKKRRKMTLTRDSGDYFDLTENDKLLIQKFKNWSLRRNGQQNNWMA